MAFVSKLVMGAAPLTPAMAFSQNSGIELPRGLTVPSPVTTTLLRSILFERRLPDYFVAAALMSSIASPTVVIFSA